MQTSTTPADYQRRAHIRTSARALFTSALQTEGLRLKDPAEVTRMANLAVSAANEMEHALDLTGPKGGPIHTPAGTSREQEAADAAGNSEPSLEGPGGAEMELGSIAVGDRVRCKQTGKIGTVGDIANGILGVDFVGREGGRLRSPDEVEVIGPGSQAGSIDSEGLNTNDHFDGSPCPFCGNGFLFGDASYRILENGKADRRAYTLCKQCGAQGPRVRHQTVEEEEKASRGAYELWRGAQERTDNELIRHEEKHAAAVCRADTAQDSLRSSELKRRGLESALEEWGAAADAVGLPDGSAPSDRLKVLPGATEVDSISSNRKPTLLNAEVGDVVDGPRGPMECVYKRPDPEDCGEQGATDVESIAKEGGAL